MNTSNALHEVVDPEFWNITQAGRAEPKPFSLPPLLLDSRTGSVVEKRMTEAGEVFIRV